MDYLKDSSDNKKQEGSCTYPNVFQSRYLTEIRRGKKFDNETLTP